MNRKLIIVGLGATSYCIEQLQEIPGYLDSRSMSIPEPYSRDLKQILLHADGAIAVISERSRDLDMFELGLAMGMGKRVLVLNYGQVPALELFPGPVIDIKKTHCNELSAAINAFYDSLGKRVSRAKSQPKHGGTQARPVETKSSKQFGNTSLSFSSKLESSVANAFKRMGGLVVAREASFAGAEKYIPDMAVSIKGLPMLLSTIPVEVSGSGERLPSKIKMLSGYIEERGLPVGVLVVEAVPRVSKGVETPPGLVVLDFDDLERMDARQFRNRVMVEGGEILRARGEL